MFQKQPRYKKVQQNQQSNLSWWESVSSTITNIRYEANKKYVELKQKFLQPEEDYELKQIIVQGKKYPTRKQAKEEVRKILWFSYRKGFNIKNEYKSDVGWGCLVRVGQMALASALVKHFQSQNQRLNMVNSDSDIQNLIAAFSDVQGVQQKYSLNKIVEVAGQQFQQKAGQWFDLSRISYCLRILQNKQPMRGSSALKVIFFDQCVNISAIFCVQNLPLCNCAHKSVICQRCHSQFKPQLKSSGSYIKNDQGKLSSFRQSNNLRQQSISSNSMKKNKASSTAKGISMHIHKQNSALALFRNKILNKDLCLFVLTRVGNKENVEKVNQAIFSLLDLSICLGVMTGFPKQAIFVVGRQANKLIYLNPHYVQQNQSLDMSNKDSNFCHEYLLCQRTQLDPSMAFCFYIQNLAEVQLLVQTINYLNKNYPDSLSIGVDYGWFNYDFNDYQQEDDDNFSVMSFQSTFQM